MGSTSSTAAAGLPVASSASTTSATDDSTPFYDKELMGIKYMWIIMLVLLVIGIMCYRAGYFNFGSSRTPVFASSSLGVTPESIRQIFASLA
jgi:hypothetical protein